LVHCCLSNSCAFSHRRVQPWHRTPSLISLSIVIASSSTPVPAEPRLPHLNNSSYRATAASPSTSPSTAAFSHQLQQLPPPGLLFSRLQHSSNTFFLLKPNLVQQHHSNHLQGALPCMVVPPFQASRPCSSPLPSAKNDQTGDLTQLSSSMTTTQHHTAPAISITSASSHL
jgi:hypothetical protein